VWLDVAPKKFFGPLGSVVMAASSDRQEPQSQPLPAPGLVKEASQGIADQGGNRKFFPPGQMVKLTIRAFIKKDCCSLHMTYASIYSIRKSIGAIH